MTNIIYRLFVFLLIFSPVAFGAVEHWSLAIIETFSFFALGLLFFRNARQEESLIYETPGIIPLILFLIYIFLQVIPLPAGMIKFISPETYFLYKKTILTDETMSWVSLSINKKATLMEFFRIMSYVIFYVITIQLMTNKEHLKKTVALIVVFASLLSFFGILQNLISNNKIFWVRELTQGGNPFGPYVNHNHYAGFMGMVFPVVLSIFLFYKPDFHYSSLRERISEFFNHSMTNIYILLGFSSMLIAISIFLSLSRGGIISLSLSMIFFGIMLIYKGKKRRRGILIILIFIMTLYAVGWFGWTFIFERFENIRNVSGDIHGHRLKIWQDSFKIIKDYPVTGTGFGTFVDIYPKYRTFSGDAIVEHAHNDYIELFAEGGIISVLLFCWFMTAVLNKSYRAFIKRRETYSIYLFLGVITGMISVLIHSFTDFNLHIGANGLYFFFLAGMAVSSANTRLREGINNTSLNRKKIPLMKQLCFIAVIMLVLSLIFNVGIMLGSLYFSSLKDNRQNKLTNDLLLIKDTVSKASFFDPLNASYRFTAGQVEKMLSNTDSAIYYYKKAIHNTPVNGEYLQMFGVVLSEIGQEDVGEKLLQTGIEFNISNPARYQIYALWLLNHNRKESGINNIKKALSLEPLRTKEYIAMMLLNGLSDEEISRALPAMVDTHVFFAEYLLLSGKEEMAENSYMNALAYAENEKEVSPSTFFKIYTYYRNKKLYEDALTVMRKAVQKLPDDINIRLSTAVAYEEAGIFYKAAEEYKKVLLLDPANVFAQKKLTKIQ